MSIFNRARGTAQKAAEFLTRDARKAARRKAFRDWHEAYRAEEIAIGERLGIPGYRAHSRIAVGLGPCPPNPDAEVDVPIDFSSRRNRNE